MPKLRNVSGAGLSLFAPEGEADAITIEPDQVIDVPGELAAEQPPDAHVVGDGDDARAWPKATWELVTDKPAAKPAAKEN